MFIRVHKTTGFAVILLLLNVAALERISKTCLSGHPGGMLYDVRLIQGVRLIQVSIDINVIQTSCHSNENVETFGILRCRDYDDIRMRLH